MLKRARCTLYLAQETDTFGKDSELASTLAQGKPVIAFVPRPTREEAENKLQALMTISGKSKFHVVKDQLQLYKPSLAWTDKRVQEWLGDSTTVDVPAATDLLFSVIQRHYDKRADTLKEIHPLGIQVNLDTGVANGVLVARSINECAELIRRTVLDGLEFRIMRGKRTLKQETKRSYYLREKLSGSVFRVMSGDLMLSNAFWNFYLEPSEELGVKHDR